MRRKLIGAVLAVAVLVAPVADSAVTTGVVGEGNCLRLAGDVLLAVGDCWNEYSNQAAAEQPKVKEVCDYATFKAMVLILECKDKVASCPDLHARYRLEILTGRLGSGIRDLGKKRYGVHSSLTCRGE